jgi:hypothetical protein
MTQGRERERERERGATGERGIVTVHGLPLRDNAAIAV